MRKIAQKAAWLADQSPLLACPVCREPLLIEETSLVCANGHRFDLSRKGTANFLNAPVKTEYSRPMLEARRRALANGLFDPFLAEIKAQLTATDRLLDIGCGEGTPTAKLAESGAAAVGFDISQPAIELAGSLATSAFFCVADLAHLPFLAGRFSAIVDLFSPGAYEEFDRVRAPESRLFKVIPQADYLRELRQGLYGGTAKGTYSNARVLARFKAAYPQAKQTAIVYDHPVDAAGFADVLAMTPLSWQAPAEKREAMLAAPPASIHVAVDLLTI
ncbi:methyltransferase domain-containing protein [Lacticaseibacillus mingshuiensis]|uniref:methyltransferase domain-containing protein n=1 Tax=Lacticaseibacillus mingshuiensis TaxID=2799574 RepID=UPI00194FEE90|nr:methyltransferase domain-containing protein [Lacticaseibacillus mingshuiensis]